MSATRRTQRVCGLPAALIAALASCTNGGGGATAAQRGATAEQRGDLRGDESEDEFPVVHVKGDADIVAPNESGVARTVTPSGSIDTQSLFFRSLGSNGRACVSCHVASQGWTVTPAALRHRFERTRGLDPIFRPNDGSTSPLADVSTLEARRSAYDMLLRKGLIRVGLGIPKEAEFELVAVDDPYGFASAAELSLFRRPLPAANLEFLSGVMWDGRETLAGMSMRQDLAHQTNSATQGHAQKPDPLTDAQREEIVAFETGLFFAQTLDFNAGPLDREGARGGPETLGNTPFYLGINDTLGADPTGKPFDPEAMTIFAAWSGLEGNRHDDARGAVARGEDLFNHKPIDIAGVRGLNDALGVPVIRGTCTSCHNTPEVGNHSVALPLDLGLTDASRRTTDMPLYTLRNKATDERLQTTDPGRALITGKWKDVSRFKGPILRGLAARPPYFHNGFAATLPEVVDFYDSRFAISFTAQEKSDLVAFLTSL